MFGKKKKKVSQPVESFPVSAVNLSDDAQAAFDKLPVDEAGMVKLGELTRNVFNRQVQYISHYFDGVGGAVDVTAGLRVHKDTVSYHEYKIHKDDALLFIGRVLAHKGRL